MSEECGKVKEDLDVAMQHIIDSRKKLEEMNKNLDEMEQMHAGAMKEFGELNDKIPSTIQPYDR